MDEQVISIDPGKNDLPWAAWVGGKLVLAGLIRTKARALGERALDFASALPVGPDVVVVEQMFYYPKRGATTAKGSRQANDLLDLAAISSSVAGYLRPKRLVFFTARDWKGTVPKDVTKNRVRDTLTMEERQVLDEVLAGIPSSLRHNVYDAVGLGLKYLKRKKLPKSVLTADSRSGMV